MEGKGEGGRKGGRVERKGEGGKKEGGWKGGSEGWKGRGRVEEKGKVGGEGRRGQRSVGFGIRVYESLSND